MLAFRCLDCGDTRWSLLGLAAAQEPAACEVCGGEMAAERRMPSTRRAAFVTDRRDGDRVEAHPGAVGA